MWTQFWDMHSGGDRKEKWGHIYIEAGIHEATVIFYNRFGHNPHRVTCTCCGEDYSISEDEELEQITGYHRNCMWDKDRGYIEESSRRGDLIPLEVYLRSDDVLVIYDKDIRLCERVGEVPDQGYVWVD